MVYNRASIEDLKQLVELRVAYLTEDTGEMNERDSAAIRRNLPDYFMRNLNKTIFGHVARNEGEIIACALLLVIEKPMSPAFITGKTGTVLNVYTKPEHRHNGHARHLMNLLMEDASNMGLSVVELKATEDGYQLYKSLGFTDAASKYYQMKWNVQI